MKTLILILSFFLAGTTFAQSPGEIVLFNAEKVNNAVVLTWSPSVSPETNHFEIQRSEDGINWRVIALMFPYEDGSVAHTYKYDDKITGESKMQYRIRQIDIHKKENFSQVKMIDVAANK